MKDPGWLSSRNLASTLTELPSGGYTAYLHIVVVSFLRYYNVLVKPHIFNFNVCVPGRGVWVLEVLLCAR